MTEALTLHASCVALDGRAALILGPPGAGKSALAIDLMAFGAGLVADDLTRLTLCEGALHAAAVEGAPALVEARGVGLAPAPLSPPSPVALAVDLAQQSAARLPPRRAIRLLGVDVPLILAARSSVVLLCLRNGPPIDPDAAPLQ